MAKKKEKKSIFKRGVAPDTPHKYKSIKRSIQEEISPNNLMLINMQMRTGDHRSIVKRVKNKSFRFMGASYIVDPLAKYYNADAKLWCLDYHQDIALPIKRDFDPEKLREDVTREEAEVEYAINPETLHTFLTAKIAEGVMKGAQIDEFLRAMRIMTIVILIFVVLHFALFVYGSGMLSNLNVL